MSFLNEYKVYTVKDGEVKKKVGQGKFRIDTILSNYKERVLAEKRYFKNVKNKKEQENWLY